MLQDDYLQRFVGLTQRSEGDKGTYDGRRPDSTLRTEGDVDGLHRNELRRLVRSLKIAHVAGDIPESPYLLLNAIVRDLKDDGWRYRALTDAEEWLDAIRWAGAQPDTLNPRFVLHQGQDRAFVVGTACSKLRRLGHEVKIGGNGPRIDSGARVAVARAVDALIAEVGGIEAIRRLCEIVCRNKRVHDGIWLLGNMVGNAHEPARPWVPVGWLVSLALRHTGRAPSADDPEDTWNAALELATLFAASMDCQSYNRFDGMFLLAPDFFPILGESLTWRELFTLPQIPASVLSVLRAAFNEVEWPAPTAQVSDEVNRFLVESERLLAGLAVDRLVEMPRATARSEFPLLWRYASAPAAGVNTGHLDPFGSEPRDQERYVFFDGHEENVFVLPSPLASAAACEAVFRLIWAKGGSAADDIVGDTIEKCVALACGRHGSRMWEKEQYRVGRTKLEIDIAVRDGAEIVLFETKAKSLRAVSRTGDMMAFFDDLTKSFIALVRQLVRHDRNLRLGLTALAGGDDDLDGLRVYKVAVSPLSYGPASDHVLSSALFRAVWNARFHATDGNSKHEKILERFHEAVQLTIQDMVEVAPKKDNQADVFAYLINVFWLDLGQLLYALERGRSVPDSLAALRTLTFSTRDFWTEAALADRQSLTERYWHPPVSPARGG